MKKQERSEVGQKGFAVNNNPNISTARDIPHMKAKSWLHNLINKSLLVAHPRKQTIIAVLNREQLIMLNRIKPQQYNPLIVILFNLSKGPWGLKQNYTQLLTPFHDTVFQALHFVLFYHVKILH